MNEDTLAAGVAIDANLPLAFNRDIMLLQLKDALANVNSLGVKLNGSAQLRDNGDIAMDMKLAAQKWNIDSVIKLIPKSYASVLADFKTLKGVCTLNAHATGVYNDTLMPKVEGDLVLENSTIAYSALPYVLNSVNADITASVDLNKQEISRASIRNVSAKTGTMSVVVKGNVDDLLGDINCDVNLKGDINLPELKPLLPDDLVVDMSGRVYADVDAAFKLDDIQNMRLEKINANGTVNYTDLDVLYNDSMHITDKHGALRVNMPSSRKKQMSGELVSVELTGTSLDFEMLDVISAKVNKPSLSLYASNPLDTTRIPSVVCDFDFAELQADMDSLSVKVISPKASISLTHLKKSPKIPVLSCAYANDKMSMEMTDMLSLETDKLAIKARSAYNSKQDNLLLKWNPLLDVDFNNGNLNIDGVLSEILIPSIKFRFTPKALDITDSRIIIDDSDFSLTGKIDNIRKYIKGKDLLLGDLKFVSENTNVDQLMALINGFGSEEQTDDSSDSVEDPALATVPEADSDSSVTESSPFMVPKGVDISFMTHIKNAVFSGNEINDVKGKLTINNGKLVLEQMGFTSNAAEMLLTGVYRSDRENHLYAGFDFHLLDIDIKELISMIPTIDSVIPMLASFEGNAEFHFAGETYLNSHYEPKMSTLRAAAAIEGKNLVLLDNETFATISKYMMFSRKARNVVDSLSVEATVFRNEVDLYPFLISMDRWQAVIAGRHNLDMSFNYHISLTDCPLPVRLGLDIKGNLDDMKFKLVPCKYAALYKPEKRNATQERTLALKKIISDSLKANVKRETDERLDE